MSARPLGRRGSNSCWKRSVQEWKKHGSAGQWVLANKEPGQGGGKLCNGRLPGQTSSALTSTASGFWSRLYMTPYQAPPTSTHEAKLRHPPVRSVVGGGPCNTYSAAVQKPWLRVATGGAMTRCLRRLLWWSAQPLRPVNSTSGRVPSPPLNLVKIPHHDRQEHPCSPQPLTGS